MATFKPLVGAVKGDKTYPVSVQLYHLGQKKYIPTQHFVIKSQLTNKLALKDQFMIDTLTDLIDGNDWLITSRQKTDTDVRIPLLPQAEELIKKYHNHPKAVNYGTLFPVISNQKMNAYLKEIADLCNINKAITFHIARHTFATTVTLSNGVPIESVSKSLDTLLSDQRKYTQR